MRICVKPQKYQTLVPAKISHLKVCRWPVMLNLTTLNLLAKALCMVWCEQHAYKVNPCAHIVSKQSEHINYIEICIISMQIILVNYTRMLRSLSSQVVQFLVNSRMVYPPASSPATKDQSWFRSIGGRACCSAYRSCKYIICELSAAKLMVIVTVNHRYFLSQEFTVGNFYVL